MLSTNATYIPQSAWREEQKRLDHVMQFILYSNLLDFAHFMFFTLRLPKKIVPQPTNSCIQKSCFNNPTMTQVNSFLGETPILYTKI